MNNMQYTEAVQKETAYIKCETKTAHLQARTIRWDTMKRVNLFVDVLLDFRT